MPRLPSLSVIVPVRNGRRVLPLTIGSLLRSDLPRSDWELIVSDDGSTDGSADLVEADADRVLRVSDGPRGPGFARNLASREARAPILVFIDADVCPHPDALTRIKEAFEKNPQLGAVFGSYDEHPGSEGFLSQYRNLYHRFVHIGGAGESETFWAGLGAIRRDLFLQVGGFDTAAYSRPQIEDIELGYRLRRAGHRILLDPHIQGSHGKRWSLLGMVRTDVIDRGVPWARLLLERESARRRAASLNLVRTEQAKVLLTGLACLLFLAATLLLDLTWAIAGAGMISIIMLLNIPLYRWFAGLRGWSFALRVVPMNLLYYLLGSVSVVIALFLHVFGSESKTRSEPGTVEG